MHIYYLPKYWAKTPAQTTLQQLAAFMSADKTPDEWSEIEHHVPDVLIDTVERHAGTESDCPKTDRIRLLGYGSLNGQSHYLDMSRVTRSLDDETHETCHMLKLTFDEKNKYHIDEARNEYLAALGASFYPIPPQNAAGTVLYDPLTGETGDALKSVRSGPHIEFSEEVAVIGEYLTIARFRIKMYDPLVESRASRQGPLGGLLTRFLFSVPDFPEIDDLLLRFLPIAPKDVYRADEDGKAFVGDFYEGDRLYTVATLKNRTDFPDDPFPVNTLAIETLYDPADDPQAPAAFADLLSCVLPQSALERFETAPPPVSIRGYHPLPQFIYQLDKERTNETPTLLRARVLVKVFFWKEADELRTRYADMNDEWT